MSQIRTLTGGPGELEGARVQRQLGMWRIRSDSAARQLLGARGGSTQAGFTAEWIPRGFLSHHPLLLSDDSGHDTQRRAVGRFFAPREVDERHVPWIRRLAAMRVGQAVRAGEVEMDTLALRFSVEVTREILGLDRSSVNGLSRRLERFFRQPPFDLTLPRLGRTPRQWAAAARLALGPLVAFHVLDVLPALRSRRRHPKADVISHLVDEGYTAADVLVEAITFGTAGMVTTREFICLVLWQLLADAELREEYTAGDTSARRALLAEIILAEPVVGHLYRRTTTDLPVDDGECTQVIPRGELVDICVREANADHAAHAADRGRDGAPDAGLSFGAGLHRCPGQPLAMAETEILVSEILLAGPEIVSGPRLGRDDLVAGYTLRGFRVRFPAPSGGTT